MTVETRAPHELIEEAYLTLTDRGEVGADDPGIQLAAAELLHTALKRLPDDPEELGRELARIKRPRAADTFRGASASNRGRSLFGELHDVWGQLEYDYEELIDAGQNVVAVVTRHARGRASGVDVETPLALLWTVREGKVTRVVWFGTRDEALEAAGLSE